MTLRALIVGLVVGWIAMSLALPAFAAEIYRCGPRGASYSQTPCADGQRLADADERNEEQRAQAQQTAARTLAMATTLESDRLATEAAHRPALAGSLSARLKQITDNTPEPSAKAKRKRASAQSTARRKALPQHDVRRALTRG